MKLLTVGDLHYNMRQFDWLMQNAAGYDLVIIVGDLLNIAGFVDLDTQIIVVRKYLRRLSTQTTLLVCSGNHDGDRKNAEGEFFADWLDAARLDNINGDGTHIRMGDWMFSVCPWWDGPVGRATVDAFLSAEAAKVEKYWFVVHHAPPSASRTSWSGKKDFGDEHLRNLILRHNPQIVLSGHVHGAPFRQEMGWYDKIQETWVFNAGYQLAPMPPYLVFDLENGQVEWRSLAGDEQLNLDLPD